MSNNIQVRDDQGNTWSVDIYNNTRTMTGSDGKLVTMDLGVTDVHIDTALANYAAGYSQWEGIADMVAPIVPSDKASNKYFTWSQDDIFQNVEDLIVGPNAAVKEISPRLSSASYNCVGYGVGSYVSTELAANADSPLKVEQAAVRRCLAAMNLGRETRVANLVTTSANWTGGTVTAIAGGAKWNGGASSNPIADLYTAIEASLTPVTGIAMSERTYHDFVQNAAVQKYVASKTQLPPLPKSNAGSLSNVGAEEFSALLGLPPILIGRMKYKNANTPTFTYVWGNGVALLGGGPGVPSDGETVSTAKTFRWTGADNGAPDGTKQGGFLVRSYFTPVRGARGGRMVIVTCNDAEIMTSVYAGGLLTSAHQ